MASEHEDRRARAEARRTAELREAVARTLLEEVGWTASDQALQRAVEEQYPGKHRAGKRREVLEAAHRLRRESESRVRRIDPEEYLRAGEGSMTNEEKDALRQWLVDQLCEHPELKSRELYARACQLRDRGDLTFDCAETTFLTFYCTGARKTVAKAQAMGARADAAEAELVGVRGRDPAPEEPSAERPPPDADLITAANLLKDPPPSPFPASQVDLVEKWGARDGYDIASFSLPRGRGVELRVPLDMTQAERQFAAAACGDFINLLGEGAAA